MLFDSGQQFPAQPLIQSITATTTRTGLKVHAELDTGTCHTGVKVTDAEIDALPMTRHRFHGDWNRTLHPDRHGTANARGTAPATWPAAAPRRPEAAALRSPGLTGMPEAGLDRLVDELAAELAELRERQRLRQRGSERRRTPGAGAKDKLATADRVLATVLYLRRLGPRDLPAQLFDITGSTLIRSIHQVQPLLAERGRTVPPSTARFRTPADVAAFLATANDGTKIKPAC
ncbi:hypothetical protein JL475_26580 [Streptomyces sp. M2CJ-2]|nr:hypothetical protein [Streptomyces sp. M2CJ-2]